MFGRIDVATAARLMTTEELHSMPDDGVERWLINGELRERERLHRSRLECRVTVRIATVLEEWNRSRTELRGEVLAGDAGVRLRRTPNSTFGVDAVYASPELLAQQVTESTIVQGVPTLAVEILSPSNLTEDVDEKIEAMLEAGVPLIWIMDPKFQTITVHRPNRPPEFFHSQQEISAPDHLPGFRALVSKLFV